MPVPVPIFSELQECAQDVDSKISLKNADRFLTYLLTTKMIPGKHIPCYRKVFTCQLDDSLPVVLKRLSKEGFTSCPVLSASGEFVTFVDMLDLVKYVTNLFFGHNTEEWLDFWENELHFHNSTIKDVLDRPYHCKQQKAFPFIYEHNSTVTLFHTLELMVKGSYHRVPVFDNPIDRNITGIFTQSMLISELCQRVPLLGALRTKLVRDMTGLWSDIITINQKQRAINAFNIMALKNVSGLAVVDDDFTLVDSISIKDLRGVGSGARFERLFGTIQDFKAVVRGEFPTAGARAHFSTNPTPAARHPLFVTPDFNFLDVLKMMDDGNIHRIYVCTSSSAFAGKPRPIHVITQTDMLKQILQQYT